MALDISFRVSQTPWSISQNNFCSTVNHCDPHWIQLCSHTWDIPDNLSCRWSYNSNLRCIIKIMLKSFLIALLIATGRYRVILSRSSLGPGSSTLFLPFLHVQSYPRQALFRHPHRGRRVRSVYSEGGNASLRFDALTHDGSDFGNGSREFSHGKRHSRGIQSRRNLFRLTASHSHQSAVHQVSRRVFHHKRGREDGNQTNGEVCPTCLHSLWIHPRGNGTVFHGRNDQRYSVWDCVHQSTDCCRESRWNHDCHCGYRCKRERAHVWGNLGSREVRLDCHRNTNRFLLLLLLLCSEIVTCLYTDTKDKAIVFKGIIPIIDKMERDIIST